MRFRLLGCLLASVLLVGVGCGTKSKGSGVPGLGRLSINLIFLANLPTASPDVSYAVVDVRNDMDRSVRVDFEGTSVAEASVGPRSTQTMRLDPGSYRVRGSGSALPSIEPPGIPITVERGKQYRLEVTYLFR